MEYIYAALLLHSTERDITEDGITSIMEAAGIEVDKGSVKALISALSGVDIDKAIAQAQPAFAPTAMSAQVQAPAPGPAPAPEAVEAEKKEKKPKEAKEEEEKEEEAEEKGMEGLSALFG